ncbi:MAG: hypothetical protein Q8Q08_06955 [Candidatus Omnitrophota bacterium]|nr:hypothetical protein [Candidatus Omnitrophota bacterium]
MSVEDLEIKIVGVDKARIRESETSGGIWIVPFKLSSKPDESWVRNFNELFRKNANIRKRKAHVIEDCIEVSVAGVDDTQQVLDVIKADVADTNSACREIFLKKIRMQEALKTLQQTQADTLQKIKDDVEKLKF